MLRLGKAGMNLRLAALTDRPRDICNTLSSRDLEQEAPLYARFTQRAGESLELASRAR